MSSASPEPLSQQEIVRAALRVTQRVGLANLSMRLVGEELARAPMSLYRHVASKEALVAQVVQSVLEQIEIPTAATMTWSERLLVLSESSRREMFRYPGIAEYLFAPHRPPRATELTRATWDIIVSAGLDHARTVTLFSCVQAHFLGHAQFHAAAEQAVHPAGRSAHRHPFPNLAEISAEQEFRNGLRLIIAGASG